MDGRIDPGFVNYTLTPEVTFGLYRIARAKWRVKGPPTAADHKRLRELFKDETLTFLATFAGSNPEADGRLGDGKLFVDRNGTVTCGQPDVNLIVRADGSLAAVVRPAGS